MRTTVPPLLGPAVVEVEPEYDVVTAYGFAFRVKRYVYPYLKQKFHNILQLLRDNARRNEFQNYCNDKRVVFITGLGHGNATTYTGQNGEILWTVCRYNPSEVFDKVIHLLSCLTAIKLGPDLMNKGASAYFGYKWYFTFVTTYPNPEDPLNDQRADPFFECDSEIDRQVTDGKKGRNVYDATYQLYTRRVEEWALKDPEVASWLLYDREALTFLP